MPYASGRLYAELSYRYFMFDDGLDGQGGGRIGGHDDQMLIGVAGYTWNLQNIQSRDQRELVQAKKAAQSVPLLKKASEELKIAQAELMDELEVVKIQKLKLEQRLDSMDQGLKAPSTTQGQMAVSSAASSPGIRFVVVVGSFRSERLAAQYVSRLKAAGVNCSISEGSNGFVRVYTGPYLSESLAFSMLDKVRVETPGAWLLRL
jgi:cell division septation protein DedD